MMLLVGLFDVLGVLDDVVDAAPPCGNEFLKQRVGNPALVPQMRAMAKTATL